MNGELVRVSLEQLLLANGVSTVRTRLLPPEVFYSWRMLVASCIGRKSHAGLYKPDNLTTC